MEPLEDEFGDIIAKARVGLGLSLDQVARETRIAIADLRAMEQTTRQPTPQEVDALARTLRLHADNLRAIAEQRWHPDPWDPKHDPQVEVLRWRMLVGAYPVYCYGLRCRRTGEVAVIDTGGQGRRVAQLLAQQGLSPRYLLMTHEHGDHIGGVQDLQRATQAPIYAGSRARVPGAHPLEDGASLPFGESNIIAYATPGHTAGCMSYVISRTAFVGDTLFAGSAGRANFSYAALLRSIQQTIFQLGDEVHLFPGHGPVTTVAQEKRHNPFVSA